jgi:siroheme synthase-like protein
MSLFPMFVKLKGRLVIVVGGGSVAEQKIPALLSAGARLRLVAPAISPQIAEWVRFGKVDWQRKKFASEDLRGTFLAIVATSDSRVNGAVYRAAEERGILCNAVDDIEHCHFYYGSVVQRGDLQIAISTNGKSPALAVRLRQELEQQFGPEYEAWLQWLGAAREAVHANAPVGGKTKRLLHELASRPMYEEFVRQTVEQPKKKGVA